MELCLVWLVAERVFDSHYFVFVYNFHLKSLLIVTELPFGKEKVVQHDT